MIPGYAIPSAFATSGTLTHDSDDDGIVDNLDLCPTQPETYNGFLDSDGCPDSFYSKLDSDMDGILDVFDECPLEPETYNKFKDGDGCPDSTSYITAGAILGDGLRPIFEDSINNIIPEHEKDADGDGIDDRWDACVDEPEIYNDYLDTDGCPDSVGVFSYVFPDADGDGTDDRWDQCLKEPEKYNGFLDWDGCFDVPSIISDGLIDSD